ncbi:Prenylcysteine oxidase-like [Homarus americanus]|uniref:Prenylcysteine oxidase-like n=1 Tax=Homarus americanus TaxID=6706 RepID=A0A8J5JS29_HOMAM|nr:Prenylcysteine oxidase-like [Homarus americanus]
MLQVWNLCLLGLLTQVRTSKALRDVSGFDTAPPKIAIIGGGIGGTSTAYFLKELFEDNAIIDLYESGAIGGRLATLPIAGYNYEVGGSIIHPKNQYMVDFTSKFGLQKSRACSGNVGLFNGEEYVYRDDSYKFVNFVKLLWRYGWDVYRLKQLTDEMLTNFARIYTLQTEGHAYQNVTSLLYDMDPMFSKMTHNSSAAWLKGFGFHDLMISELITAVTLCNYGQTPDVHAFVVRGGNKRVAEELLKHSRAAYLRRLVAEITPNGQGHFKVTSSETETPDSRVFSEENPSNIADSDLRSQDYDIVVIAAPLTKDNNNIKFVNFTKEFDFPGHYERIICTMVQGKVTPESLLLTPDDAIDEILVTNPKLMFNSFGKQCPVDAHDYSYDNPDVWKIFSSAPLEEDQLNIFFSKRNSTNVIDWLAYPHYDSDQKLGDFELLPGMYHVNAIEWAGSAMEMSIIGAKNVALLAYKYWLQNPNAGMKMPLKDEL